MIKKTLKKLFKPAYRRLLGKLREGLQTDEQFQLLHHIVAQNTQLRHDVAILQHEITMLYILMGGIEPEQGTGAFALTPEDTARDIINILAPSERADVSIVQLLNKLDQHYFQGKSICLVGAGTAFFKKELERRGAGRITRIELNPLLMKESGGESGEVISVYPSRLRTVSIPGAIDILIVANPAVSAYLLKRKLLHLSAAIKESGLFLLAGDAGERKHLATLITGSGFSEVREIPDGLTMSFDYRELRELPKKTLSDKQETVLYRATKLPDIR